MNLKDKLNKKSEKLKKQSSKHEEYSKKIIELIPKKINSLAQWVHDILDGIDGLDLKVHSEDMSLFYNYDNSKIGLVAINLIDVKYWNKSIKFHLEPGIGYIGATAHIRIDCNVPKWEEQTDIRKGGLFLTIDIDNNYSVNLFTIDKSNKIKVFSRTELEVFLETILNN